MRTTAATGVAALAVFGTARLAAEERFPPPEFSSTGHTLPTPTQPLPDLAAWELFDVLLLGGLILWAAWLILKKRSRRGVCFTGLCAVFYFGFWREGCICPIGAIQNVAQAAFDGSALPWVVLGFFFLPLFGTLLFGRVYCGAVCPHGALQDLIGLKPVSLPRWLQESLGLLPWLYLGLAVLYAVNGAAYVICEYDPFIALFRLNGSLPMLLFGGGFLLLSVFIGRPYCRFLCPYGAILRVLSTLSLKRVTIYPDRCIDCRLCDSSCPYGAIRPRSPAATAQDAKASSRRRVVWALAAVPVLAVALGLAGRFLGEPLSRLHPAVRQAAALTAMEQPPVGGTVDLLQRDQAQAFRQQRGVRSEAIQAAVAVQARFVTGGGWLGVFIGLVIGLKLTALARPQRYRDYEADRAGCLACARCFDYCPGEQGLLDPNLKAGGFAA